MKLLTKLLLLFVVASAVPVRVAGVETAVWQVADFKEFLKGHLTGVSIRNDGTLGLAPEAKAVWGPDEALALSLVGDRHHDLYIGTGHQGKVFRATPDGKASLFFTAPEPDIFALAVGPRGDLYVGSSPEGKIYRVTPDGKSSVFYEPSTKYIWALLFGPDGELYVGTGDQGQILRVDTTGKGSVFFDSTQTHIMCLAFDKRGNLLAGSVPGGLVYRIDSKGKGFVLYQSDLPEIHDLVVDARGRIYAAALGAAGGAVAPLMLMPQTPKITLPTQVVTVTAQAPSAIPQDSAAAQKPKKPKPQPPRKKAGPSFIQPGQAPTGIMGLIKPHGRGALIEISPDSTAETLWDSNKESIYAVAPLGKRILFSTDSGGQIFELDPSQVGQNLTLLAETRESVATRLWLDHGTLYIATSNIAKLFRMKMTPGREGTYESPVKDTKFVSHWGVLRWRGNTPSGSSIEFYTRTGNSKRPDETWSGWAGPDREAANKITSPSARYIQWKAVFRGSASAQPTLDETSVAYLNQNLPPAIHMLKVSNAGERTSTTTGPVPSLAPGVSISVGSAANIYSAASSQENNKDAIIFDWQADDPNGDTLVYSIYVKATDERDWHLVKEKIESNRYTLDPSSLPDGEYVAKLVASDAPSNPPATTREDSILSSPFWVDNTPPEVHVESQTVKAGRVTVRFIAEDATSPLRSAQSAVDSNPWQDLYSDDGIVDSRMETFTVKVRILRPGEHIITLRAYDTAGNVGVGKAVIEIPEN